MVVVDVVHVASVVVVSVTGGKGDMPLSSSIICMSTGFFCERAKVGMKVTAIINNAKENNTQAVARFGKKSCAAINAPL